MHGRAPGAHPSSGGPVERAAESRRLTWVLALTAVFMVAEIVGGVLSNSLALLADAGHMFTDVGALALSLFAMTWAQRLKRVFNMDIETCDRCGIAILIY